jgi:hypothetical protein
VSDLPPLCPTRRGALTGGLTLVAGLLTSGCDLPGSPSSDPTEPGTPTTDARRDPDLDVVAGVREDLAGTGALVATLLRTRPSLQEQAAPFRRLHRQHLAALEGDPVTGRDPRLSGSDAAVLARMRAAEERLERTLAGAAVAARSGALAALLASMSAAVAQQLAVTSAGAP